MVVGTGKPQPFLLAFSASHGHNRASTVAVSRPGGMPVSRLLPSLALTVLILPGAALAADPPKLADLPPPAGLVAPDTKATAAAGVCFLEGPAVDEKGNVFFSDISGNRILKMNADGQVSVFRA